MNALRIRRVWHSVGIDRTVRSSQACLTLLLAIAIQYAPGYRVKDKEINDAESTIKSSTITTKTHFFLLFIFFKFFDQFKLIEATLKFHTIT
jgi:hypothetical protein